MANCHCVCHGNTDSRVLCGHCTNFDPQVEDERRAYTPEVRYSRPTSRQDRSYGYGRPIRMARRVHPYGSMKIVKTTGKGRLMFLCRCGWMGWNCYGDHPATGYGPAGKHAKECVLSDGEPCGPS